MSLHGTITLESHRLLPLQHDDVAVLSDRSTGWCILRRSEYEALSRRLSKGGLDSETADKATREVLQTLWEAGLLCAEGKSAASTAPDADSSYPDALLLKLTGACNLQCTYCYDYDAHRFKARLSFDQIARTISSLLAHREKLSVVFHGGEPLLRFDLIQQVVDFALAAAGRSDRVAFSVQTNATRFTSDVVTFLDRHRFSVGISLDGSDELANALRVSAHGRSPLECVRDLLAQWPQFARERCGFLAVASRTSAPRLPEFALWLQEEGISGLSISFLDLTGRAATLKGERLTSEEAVQVYRTLVDMIHAGKIGTLAIHSLLSRIDNLFTLRPRDLCHRGPCGAASEFLVLDAQGTLRTCDCVYDPFFVIGPADQGIAPSAETPARVAIVERHQWLRERGPLCATCPLFGLCGGTCVAKTIASAGSPWGVDPVECALARYLYPELLQEFASGGTMPLFEYYQRHKQAVLNYAMDTV